MSKIPNIYQRHLPKPFFLYSFQNPCTFSKINLGTIFLNIYIYIYIYISTLGTVQLFKTPKDTRASNKSMQIADIFILLLLICLWGLIDKTLSSNFIREKRNYQESKKSHAKGFWLFFFFGNGGVAFPFPQQPFLWIFQQQITVETDIISWIINILLLKKKKPFLIFFFFL